jgi:tRNA pseudouridine65 synthase
MEIIYQDKEFAVLNKAVNLPVTHNSHMPKDALYLNKIAGNYFNENIYNPHRLDSKTSGLTIVCFNKAILESFNHMFRNAEIQKTYTALVKGDIPESGIIDKEIFDRKKRKKLAALTEYERINRIETKALDKNGKTIILNILKIIIHTGRWHQIRQHLSGLRFDLVGDTQHGDWDFNKRVANEIGINRMCLHASELKFRHPITNELLHLKSEVPEDFHAILNFNFEL